jgi:hypothetical protein
MSFNNPAGSAREGAEAYRQALLALLGDRDPLTVMTEQAGALRSLTDGVPAEVLRRVELPGKWSAHDVLQHLVDTETVYTVRYRMVVAQDRPRITGFDQDAWASNLGYTDIDAELLLHELDTVRQRNLRLLRGIPQTAFERVGLHDERGEETLGDMLRLGAAHDLVHRQQIERILEAVATA